MLILEVVSSLDLVGQINAWPIRKKHYSCYFTTFKSMCGGNNSVHMREGDRMARSMMKVATLIMEEEREPSRFWPINPDIAESDKRMKR